MNFTPHLLYQKLQAKIPVLQKISSTNFLLILFSLFLAFLWAQASPHTKEEMAESTTPEVSVADTQIPRGYVLIPIEIQNSESLDSLFGSFGVVNLYHTDPQKPGKSLLVAKRIKMLRAPQNPNRFAVLAREEDAPHLLSFAGMFNVIVQNPKESGTDVVNQEKPRGRGRIQYFTGDEN